MAIVGECGYWPYTSGRSVRLYTNGCVVNSGTGLMGPCTGMCDGGTDFKDMMNIVIGVLSRIQQQAEMKIKKAEEKGAKVQDRIESVNIENLDDLMTATILPKLNEEWEHPQYEATKYLAALFEYWLHKGMFPDKRPIVQIVVKFNIALRNYKSIYEVMLSHHAHNNQR